jgi:hypothetical protein
MRKKDIKEWIERSTVKQILLAFYGPRTPGIVQQITGIKKLKLKPYIERNLIKCLNSGARKGRLYTITNKSRKLLTLPTSKNQRDINWAIKGWIIASPRQRLVVLKNIDSVKRTSEEIRERASKLNTHLTRISTKGILKEHVNKNLVATKIKNRKRYYWINDNGRLIVKDIDMRDKV